jgi:hypothetical protein
MAARVIEGPDKEWLNWDDVKDRVRMGETQIREEMAAGRFPTPLRQQANRTLWWWEQISAWERAQAWIPAARPKTRDAPPASE